ncbi:MAG: NUDIX domain-containing protein [Patescibacteria group bacterium]
MTPTEQCDVLDEHGNPTGQMVDRETAHQQGLWHGVVRVWIVNPDRQLLLQQRSANRKAFPHLWELSASGHMQAGDTAVQTAQRETLEELGLTIDAANFELVFRVTKELTVPDVGSDNEWGENFLVERAVDPADIKLDSHEVAAIRWVPIGELALWYADRPTDFYPRPNEWPRMITLLRKRYGEL